MENFVNDLWEIFMPVVSMLLVTVAVPAIIALSVKGFQKLGIDITAQQRDTVQSALTNAAGLLVQRLGPGAAGMTNLSGQMHNPVVQAAIQRVKEGAGDSVAKFKMTDHDIAKGIEGKLGILTGVTGEDGAVPSVPASKAV